MGEEGRWFLVLVAVGLAAVVSLVAVGRWGQPGTFRIAGSYVPPQQQELYAADYPTGICNGYAHFESP